MIFIFRIIILLFCCCFLCGCNVYADENLLVYKQDQEDYCVSNIEYIENTIDSTEMRGMWVSQFDMHPIYRDGNKQRDITDYRKKVNTLLNNLANDRFNTVFLQLRPNGDSIYESKYYPASKYVAGIYGGEIEYDPVPIFLELAKEKGISVHAWINPYRLCSEEELINYGKGQIYNWYKEGIGKRIELGLDGILYLDPAYPEATDLIASGAEEILLNYDFEGIHIDDYFYPTEFEFDDEFEFLKSGADDKGDFRRNNINRTILALYNTAHKNGKLFGISPAGNLYSLKDGWYADVELWCSKKGYIDYIMPQLYFGFENQTCPFEKVFKDWCNAVTEKSVKLYIGLSAAKCVLGSEGILDKHAGESGKYEWRDNKDILAKSLAIIKNTKTSKGFCIFTYSSFYNPLSGAENPLCQEEKSAFCQIIKGS